MTVYTVGYLGKLWYEAIEGLIRLPEVAQAMGLSQYETALVVVPESANELISTPFSYSSTTSDLGQYWHSWSRWNRVFIDLYLRFLQYDKVLLIFS